MAMTFAEPGGDADFAIATSNGFWQTIGGSAPTIVTDFVHGSHIKSIQPLTSGISYLASKNGVCNDSGTRMSIYIYLNALPTVSAHFIFGSETINDGSNVVSVLVSTTGVLQLFRGVNSAQIGSDGSTLSTGVWYRICLAYTITSSTINEFRVYKNGVLDITGSNIASVTTGSSDLLIGNIFTSSTINIRYSDIYVDDSSSLNDTGDIWVTAKRPYFNGISNQFTTQIGSGGSGYGSGHTPQINERPLNILDGWSLSNTTKSTEEFTIENQYTGDFNLSNATIIDYMGWISASVNSTANSPVHHIILNGVATAVTLTTSPVLYMQIAGSTTYPGGGTDIGIDAQYTTTPHTTSLYECGIIFAFNPAPIINSPFPTHLTSRMIP